MRADNLGSLLRPPYLLEARGQDLPDDELAAVEDRAIRDAIALQEEVGLTVVTDGEYRRRFFFSTIEVLFDGIDPTGFIRHHQDFEGVQHELRTPTPVARLSRRATARRARGSTFVRAHTDKLVKVTLPCPSMFPNYWSEGVSNKAYADREAYLEHLVELMNEDAKALVAAGRRLHPARRAALRVHPEGDVRRRGSRRDASPADRDGQQRARRGRRRDDGVAHLPRQRPQPLHRHRAVRRVRGVDLPAHGRPSGCCSSTTTSAPAASSRCAGRATTRRSCSAS